MPEQLRLDFEAPTPTPHQETAEEKRTRLEQLPIEELEIIFRQAVGYDAQMRFLSMDAEKRKTLLIDGIIDPAHGKDSVAQWDKQYDGIGDVWSDK